MNGKKVKLISRYLRYLGTPFRVKIQQLKKEYRKMNRNEKAKFSREMELYKL